MADLDGPPQTGRRNSDGNECEALMSVLVIECDQSVHERILIKKSIKAFGVESGRWFGTGALTRV